MKSLFQLRYLAIALFSSLFCFQSGAENFDSARAMKLIAEQCAFGPRIPGTEAQIKGRDWISAQIKAAGMALTTQEFSVTLPLTGAHVQAWNLWATARPDGPVAPAIVISAHWDTRPFADQDPSGSSPMMLGANDGGSGVAMGLELARALQGDPIRDHLVLAFWDAEDSGTQQDMNSWGLGAAYSAKNPPAWIGRVALGINLDMVAGAELSLRRETYSVASAPKAVEGIWSLGSAMTPARFNNGEPSEVTDDHLPWIRAGVPWVDLIGFPYHYWHTAGDTPEHCSASSMSQLGAVLVQYIRSGDWEKQGRRVASSGAAKPASPAQPAATTTKTASQKGAQ